MPHSQDSPKIIKYLRSEIHSWDNLLFNILTFMNPDHDHDIRLYGDELVNELFSKLNVESAVILERYPDEKRFIILAAVEVILDCAMRVRQSINHEHTITPDIIETNALRLIEILLKEHPGATKEVSDNGLSLLFLAISNKFENVAALLIDYGASPNEVYRGQNAAQFALMNNSSAALLARLLTPENKNLLYRLVTETHSDPWLEAYFCEHKINFNNFARIAALRATEKYLTAVALMPFYQSILRRDRHTSHMPLLFSVNGKQQCEQNARASIEQFCLEVGYENLNYYIKSLAENLQLENRSEIPAYLHAIFGGEGSYLAEYAVSYYSQICAPQAEQSAQAEEELLQQFGNMGFGPRMRGQ